MARILHLIVYAVIIIKTVKMVTGYACFYSDVMKVVM